jgi:hypothetical protein
MAKREPKKKKNQIGRPPKYDDPEKMLEDAQGYFGTEDRPTISGVALHLGFCDRHSMYAYEKKPEFSHTIKAIRSQLSHIYERETIWRKDGQVSGPLFMLKNLGYTDKQDITLSGNPDAPLKQDVTITPEKAYMDLMKD